MRVCSISSTENVDFIVIVVKNHAFQRQPCALGMKIAGKEVKVLLLPSAFRNLDERSLMNSKMNSSEFGNVKLRKKCTLLSIKFFKSRLVAPIINNFLLR